MQNSGVTKESGYASNVSRTIPWRIIAAMMILVSMTILNAHGVLSSTGISWHRWYHVRPLPCSLSALLCPPLLDHSHYVLVLDTFDRGPLKEFTEPLPSRLFQEGRCLSPEPFVARLEPFRGDSVIQGVESLLGQAEQDLGFFHVGRFTYQIDIT